MELSEFKIGDEFECDDRRWRCTDIGTRVVVAIRVDRVEVGGTGEPKTLDQTQAEEEGWFNGPPYAVAERVFDEDEQERCEPINGSVREAELGALRRKIAEGRASGEPIPAERVFDRLEAKYAEMAEERGE